MASAEIIWASSNEEFDRLTSGNCVADNLVRVDFRPTGEFSVRKLSEKSTASLVVQSALAVFRDFSRGVAPSETSGGNVEPPIATKRKSLSLRRTCPRQDLQLLATRKVLGELLVEQNVHQIEQHVDNARKPVKNSDQNVEYVSPEQPESKAKASTEICMPICVDENDCCSSDSSSDDIVERKKRKTEDSSVTSYNFPSASKFSNGTPKPPVRGRPNCRRTAKDIEASISAAELKSKDPMFSTYHDELPSIFDYIITSVKEKPANPLIPNQKCFSLTIRLNIQNKEEAIMWLEEYQILSRCDFRIRDSKKENTDRLLWKKMYQCHHNVRQRTCDNEAEEIHENEPPTQRTPRISKHTGCLTTMRITIKQKHMKWSSDQLLQKYPCEILINFDHNHLIDIKEALRRRRPTKAVTEKFKELFAKGHSPSSAVETHKFDLEEEHGDNYFVVSADRSQCPDVKWASRLYYAIFRKEYGEPHGDEMIASFKEFINRYNQSEGSTCAALEILNGTDMVVAICTPLMARVHERIKSAGELMLVDSSGTMDVLNTRVFLLLCPSIAGALPLGVLMVSSEAEIVVKAGLDLLLSLIPEEKAFGGRGKLGPKIIMTDQSDAERGALGSVFNFAILLLCLFHILQAFWRYVWKGQHKVEYQARSPIFFAFREVVYAPTEEKFEELWQNLVSIPEVQNNSTLLKHLNGDLKPKYSEWALCMRRDLLTRGIDTNNFSEAAMKLLKDKACQRQKCFSPIQLFDFIVTRFCSIISKRIIDVINNRALNTTRTRFFISPEKLVPLKCKKLKYPNAFSVENSEKGTEYIVSMSDEVCSCPMGRNGAPCKHQAAVVRDFRPPSTQISNYSHNDDPKVKEDLFYVVYGASAKIPENWFSSLVPHEQQDISANLSFEDRDDNIEMADALEIATDGVPDSNAAQPTSEDDERAKRFPIEEVSENLKCMVNGWIDRLSSKPEIFVNAFQAMIQSNAHVSRTDSALQSALHTFGKEMSKKRNANSNIPVNNPSRRTVYLGSGKRSTITGRPSKAMLQRRAAPASTTANSQSVKEAFWHTLPHRRERAPHNMTQCAKRNISLGKTHHRK